MRQYAPHIDDGRRHGTLPGSTSVWGKMPHLRAVRGWVYWPDLSIALLR